MRSKPQTQLALLFGEAFFFALSSGVVAIVVAQWGGAELIGQYSLVLAWVALFQAFANFGLSEFTMRELGRVHDKDGKYIYHGLLIGIGTSLICMAMMAGIVVLFEYPENMRNALLLGTLTLAPMTASSICRAGFLANNFAKFIVSVALVDSLLTMSINSYLAIEGYGITIFVATLVGTKIITSLLSLRLLGQHVTRPRWTFDAKFGRELFSTLLTFALGNVLGIVAVRINLILISLWATISAVGLYAVASKVLELVLIIPSMFAHWLLPRLAGSYARDRSLEIREFLAKSLPWMWSLVLVSAGGAAALAPWLLALLFGPEFADGGPILRVLMVFAMIESVDTIMAVLLRAAGYQKLDVRLFMTNVGTNISCCFLLIPTWGGFGCAVAKLLGVIVSATMRYSSLVHFATEATSERAR
jgi:O-antigen/teichoic acid export membrane protein